MTGAGAVAARTADGKRRRQSGFALLIVLWTVGFLALLGTRIVAAGRSDTQLADNLKRAAVLEAAADGAVAHVMFSIVAAREPGFQPDGMVRTIRIGQTQVLVRVLNENDRINLNTASRPVLRALINDVGGSPAVADRIAAAIVAWRDGGTAAAQATVQYRAAGLSHGPPGAPFQSVDELADVLGMTPGLLQILAPHLTVLTSDDPDMTTHDPVVARALADVAGLADVTATSQPAADESVLRIVATAVGAGDARFILTVVGSANFLNAQPHINILLRERADRDAGGIGIAAGS